MKTRLIYYLKLLILLACACKSATFEYSQEQDISSEIDGSHEMVTQFESDSLSPESLKIFEIRAMQKLKDISDYLQIMADTSIKIAFREQAKEMFLSNFINSDVKISIPGEVGNMTISRFSDSLLYSKNRHLELSTVSLMQTVEFMPYKDHIYKSMFSFTMKDYDDQSSHGTLMSIEVFVVKNNKEFGGQTRWIWEILFGDVATMDVKSSL